MWPHWVFVALRGLSLVVASRGCSLVAGGKLLIELLMGFSYCGRCALGTNASVVAAHRLSSSGVHTLGLKGSVAVEHRHLPGPGIKLVCPALADRVLSTAPPGKFHRYNF